MVKQLADVAHLQIIMVILVIAGFVELLDASGGAFAFAHRIGSFVNSKERHKLQQYFLESQFSSLIVETLSHFGARSLDQFIMN